MTLFSVMCGFLSLFFFFFVCLHVLHGGGRGNPLQYSRLENPTPVFSPGESHGQRSLAGYSPWVAKSQTWLSDWTELNWTMLFKYHFLFSSFLCSSVGKESACSAGDPGSIPGSGKSPVEGNGNPLQYPCLENSMDRGALWVAVHGVAKSRAWLSN